ncbi:MAG: DUF262 domain-containing protein [Magnetococcales bacterium]|nr:DUF262 domain-containing protein [Magnetococcales bacterium]NGZ27724.1 DUF262 domain-containing protein [Magnetococcales bacterium]
MDNLATPSFYKEPQIQYLHDLLNEIRKGLIRIPRFQRPFVWTPEQRLELLASIKEGLPIGAIMIWRTTRNDIQYYPTIGPHPLNFPQATSYQYLLDGVQRLSTLFGALYQPNFNSEEFQEVEENDFTVYYDLDEKEFISGKASANQLMPLTYILNSYDLISFQRGLQGEKVKQWIEESDRIAHIFRNYKIPVIPISTDDYSQATKSFQRINSSGTTMLEAHMVHALSWSPKFDFLKQLEEMKERYLAPLHWDGVDDDLILRICKGAYDLDLHETKPKELSDKIKEDPSQLEYSIRALADCANFLYEHCYVPIPELVPYVWQTILLTDTFRRHPNLAPEMLQGMKAWFWITTFSEMFEKLTGFQHRKLFNEFREMTNASEFKFSKTIPPPHINFNNNYIINSTIKRVVTIMLYKNYTTCTGNKDIDPLIREKKANCLQRLFFQRSETGNYFLIEASQRDQLMNTLMHKQIDDNLLKRHLISRYALASLQNDNRINFINTRSMDIQKFKEELLIECLGLLK